LTISYDGVVEHLRIEQSNGDRGNVQVVMGVAGSISLADLVATMLPSLQLHADGGCGRDRPVYERCGFVSMLDVFEWILLAAVLAEQDYDLGIERV
jgi:hypothetical protein